MPHWAQKFMANGKMQWILPPPLISQPMSLLPRTRLQQAHCSILTDSLSFWMSHPQATEQILHRFYAVIYSCILFPPSQHQFQRLKCAMNTKSQAKMDQVWTFRVTVINNILYPKDQIPKLLVLLLPKIKSVSAFCLKIHSSVCC